MSRCRIVRAIALSACAIAAGFPGGAFAADIPANPATFSSAVGAAGPGDVVVLAPGDYGTWNGAAKPGVVTIRPAVAGSATMRLRLNGSTNLTFDGLTFGDIEMTGAQTRHITVRNSTINGQTVLRTGYLQNANILFDGNVHGAWDKCNGCGEGRVWLPQKTSQPSGITIQNSRFGPGGDSDGIQNGSNGTRILNNEFVGLVQGSSDVHVDSIQLYGSSNTLVQGNYFHDDTVHIMAPDGGDHETIVDNVFVGAGYIPAVQLGGHVGTVFAHNTARNINVHMDSKSGESGSRDGEIRDNVMVNGSFNTTSGGGCSNCSIHHNLFTRRTQGSDAILGTPVFENSGTYAGHRLAAGSPGKGNASDGLDRGARINPHAAGPPPATGTAPGAAARPTVRLLSSKRFIRRRGRLRLRVGMVQAGTVALVARLRPKARSGARPIKLRAKVLRFQTAGTRKVTLRLSRDARRRFRRWGKPRLVVRTFADVARSSPTGSFRFAVRRRG